MRPWAGNPGWNARPSRPRSPPDSTSGRMSRKGSARSAPPGPTTRITPSCSLTKSRLLPSPELVTLMGHRSPLAKASRCSCPGSSGLVDVVATAVAVGVAGRLAGAGADTWGLALGPAVPWLPLASTSATARSGVTMPEVAGWDGRGVNAMGRLTIALQATSAFRWPLRRAVGCLLADALGFEPHDDDDTFDCAPGGRGGSQAIATSRRRGRPS